MDMNGVDVGFVQNVQGLDKLRQMSHADITAKKDALVTAAQQFESILNQFWLKEMRSANESICPDSPLNSRDSSFFQSMLDEQMITNVSKSNMNNPSSITMLLVKQFAHAMGDEGKEIIKEIENANNPNKPLDNNLDRNNFNAINTNVNNNFMNSSNIAVCHDSSCFADNVRMSANKKDELDNKEVNAIRSRSTTAKKASVYDIMQNTVSSAQNNAEAFVQKYMPIAEKIGIKFNLNPLVIIAQAALETGWGKSLTKGNNFFGIKANKAWQGASEEHLTSEYMGGKKFKEVASFRSYQNAESSFEDYAKFVTSNDRYADAVSHNSDPDLYFEKIQSAGYATDPNYASKLKSILRNDAFKSYRNTDKEL